MYCVPGAADCASIASIHWLLHVEVTAGMLDSNSTNLRHEASFLCPSPVPRAPWARKALKASVMRLTCHCASSTYGSLTIITASITAKQSRRPHRLMTLSWGLPLRSTPHCIAVPRGACTRVFTPMRVPHRRILSSKHLRGFRSRTHYVGFHYSIILQGDGTSTIYSCEYDSRRGPLLLGPPDARRARRPARSNLFHSWPDAVFRQCVKLSRDPSWLHLR